MRSLRNLTDNIGGYELTVNDYANGYRLLRREDLLGDPWHPLDGVTAPELVPPNWTHTHVGKRLSEAFEILGRMPNTRGPRAFGNAWPGYLVEWEDEIARAAMEAADKDARIQERNRVRIQPSSIEIQHIEAAIAWPAHYLLEIPQLLRTVGACAFVEITRARSRSCGSRMGDIDHSYHMPSGFGKIRAYNWFRGP